MNLFYLNTAQLGLRWMRRYYREHPQLNAKKAVAALLRAENILQNTPFAGQSYEGNESVRSYRLSGTAFSFLYTIEKNTVWIIDVRDSRGERSAVALRRFTTELRQRLKNKPKS